MNIQIDSLWVSETNSIQLLSNQPFNTIQMGDFYPFSAADDYLAPSVTESSYVPHYENEDALPISSTEKLRPNSIEIDNLPSPNRYTSSPTLGQATNGIYPEQLGQFYLPLISTHVWARKFTLTLKDDVVVDTTPVEDYLEPNSSASARERPDVDDDGYLRPNLATGYIDVLAGDQGKHMWHNVLL